jgi:hypothetical protein
MATLNNPGEVLLNPPADGVSALTFSGDSDLLLVCSWDSVRGSLFPPFLMLSQMSMPPLLLESRRARGVEVRSVKCVRRNWSKPYDEQAPLNF